MTMISSFIFDWILEAGKFLQNHLVEVKKNGYYIYLYIQCNFCVLIIQIHVWQACTPGETRQAACDVGDKLPCMIRVLPQCWLITRNEREGLSVGSMLRLKINSVATCDTQFVVWIKISADVAAFGEWW